MATTTTLVSWTPQVVTAPIEAAHVAATAEAARAAQALAPGRIQVHAASTSTHEAALTASGPGAVQQEFGVGPHEIAPGPKKVLAGPKFGPVGGTVHHPGNPALHYTRKGAETYREAFIAAAKRLLPG